jgi:hydroxylamine reductase (hybrid-cluster protein)
MENRVDNIEQKVDNTEQKSQQIEKKSSMEDTSREYTEKNKPGEMNEDDDFDIEDDKDEPIWGPDELVTKIAQEVGADNTGKLEFTL